MFTLLGMHSSFGLRRTGIACWRSGRHHHSPLLNPLDGPTCYQQVLSARRYIIRALFFERLLKIDELTGRHTLIMITVRACSRIDCGFCCCRLSHHLALQNSSKSAAIGQQATLRTYSSALHSCTGALTRIA